MENIRKLFNPTDMTSGKPWKNIVRFSIPMLIGNIAQQLYSTVDSVVVGHYVGDSALAAVGSAAPLFSMLLVLFTGISAGVGIMVAQYFGAKDRVELSRTIGTSITVTGLVSAFLMLAAPLLIRSVLLAMNTPASIIDDSTTYLVILMYGVAGLAYYNILSGILRGMGDSFSALMYLLLAAGLNIILDIYFVVRMDMGIAGVSIATVIAQGVSALLCLRKLTRMQAYFDLGMIELKISKRHAIELVKLGLPSGVAQAIMCSAMVLVQSLTNSFGEMVVAANVIVMRVDGFAMMPAISFGTAMTTFTGQNAGAGKYERIRQGARQGTILAVSCSCFITLTILVYGKYLMMIFTETEELVNMSAYIMRILAVGYIAIAVNQSLAGVMRGAGDTIIPMMISIVTTIIIYVPMAYGISWMTKTPDLPYGRFECVSVALLLCWVLAGILSIIFYKTGRWKKTMKFRENNFDFKEK